MKHNILRYILCLLLCFLFSACASSPSSPGAGQAEVTGGASEQEEEEDNRDSIENINRPIFTFNDVLDRFILEPLSTLYEHIVPDPLKEGIGNFFDNAGEINNLLNNSLQGKWSEAADDLVRLTVNTTLGAGGLFDVASEMGVPLNNEDLGQTLAVWGVGQGPYLVLPFAGPSTLRDLPGLGVTVFTNPLRYLDLNGLPTQSISGVHARYNAQSKIDAMRLSAIDPYVYLREAYFQRRFDLIYDGNPPIEELFKDSFDDEFFDEMDDEETNNDN